MTSKSDEETIRLIVKKLVAEYSPQRVVLFGSHAYGTPDRDSDIDLLIIKDTQESFLDRVVRVRRAVSGMHRGIPFDPLVLTPQEVEARLKLGDQFIAEILEKGRVLYGLWGVQLPDGLASPRWARPHMIGFVGDEAATAALTVAQEGCPEEWTGTI